MEFMAADVEGFALRRTGRPSKEAVLALHMLSFPTLASGLREKATRPGGGFIRLLGLALTRLLARPAKDAALQARGLFAGVGVMNLVFTADVRRTGFPLQLMDELIGALMPAVAAVMVLVEWDSASEYCHQGAAALFNLLTPCRQDGAAAALARHPLELVRITEALARLAARIRRTLAATPAGHAHSVSALLHVGANLVLPDLHAILVAAPEAVLLSREGLDAIAGLLDSTSKIALQLAHEGRAGADKMTHSSGVSLLDQPMRISFVLLGRMRGSGGFHGQEPDHILRSVFVHLYIGSRSQYPALF